MSASLSGNLSMKEQAEIIMNKGSFIEAEDYYSYRILHYTYDNQTIELLFDFSDQILSIERIDDSLENSVSWTQ